MNSRGLRSVVLGLGVASCVAVTACGDDETSTNAGSGGGGGTGGGGSAGSPGLDGETITPGPFDISGSFAVQAVIKARAIIDLDTTQYFLVTFDQNGTHLDVATRTCDIALPSVPDVAEVVIPDKLRDVFRRDVVMTAGDFVSGTDGGAKYTPPAEVVVLGADLANPATDPLPTATSTSLVASDSVAAMRSSTYSS